MGEMKYELVLYTPDILIYFKFTPVQIQQNLFVASHHLLPLKHSSLNHQSFCRGQRQAQSIQMVDSK